MTYSIVARDAETGQLGVAVQTCWFGVGSMVPWAEPGAGAVATQSFTEISYGPRGLELMRAGRDPASALRELLATDEGAAVRQVGMVDAGGRSAAHTGDGCVAAAGHLTESDVSVQANMMERDSVWPAMLAAYRGASGDLADRLLVALRAADAEGGDIRGRQSAALLVVPGSGPPWAKTFDLRVEDHRAPLDELERLLRLARAYDASSRAGDLAGEGRMDEAVALDDRASSLAPDDPQIAFWHGLTLLGAGRMDEARPFFEQASGANPRFADYLRRLAAAGVFPNVPEIFDAVLPV
jgi:uncharacterized Ntn-hydrolase superfamily protein